MTGRLGRRVLCAWVAVSLTACIGDPTPPAYPGDTPATEPGAGAWKTWVLVSPDEISVPAPPAPGSGESTAELEELRALASNRGGAVDVNIRRWDRDPIVTPWMELRTSLQKVRAPDPPASSRQDALLNVAIYDAVVSAWHWKYVYDRAPPTGVGGAISPGSDPSYPSEHAVIAGAAARMLSYLYPERPAALLDQLADQAGLSRVQAGVNFRSDVDQGLILGRAVADQVIKRARADNSDARWDGKRPEHGPAHWEPAPGTTTPPVEPTAGSWKPWVLGSGVQFRAPPPPPPGSPEFAREAGKVKDAAAHRTKDQEHLATTWNEVGGGPTLTSAWAQTALSLIQRDHLTTPRASRVLALVSVAEADSTIAAWDSKYAHWAPRPENSLRDLGIVPTFTSFLPNPSYPGYVSEYAADSGAAAGVLSYLFPGDEKDLSSRAGDAGRSRLYGGVDFPIDISGGARIGEQVAQVTVTWARGDGSGR